MKIHWWRIMLIATLIVLEWGAALEPDLPETILLGALAAYFLFEGPVITARNHLATNPEDT